jgi:hypothetical protein
VYFYLELHHHKPINVPTAGAQAFLMEYPEGERAITHHAGPVRVGRLELHSEHYLLIIGGLLGAYDCKRSRDQRLKVIICYSSSNVYVSNIFLNS